jgi:3-hydroxybutyrate dehydrogenase
VTKSLEGKTAFITGSVQGIGLAIANTLAAEGARIALHGLADAAQQHEACDAVTAAGAPDARFFEGDLRDPGAIEMLVKNITEWGAVDILINNAGIQKTVTLQEATRDTWDTILAVNLSAAFDTMRMLLPPMADRGYGRVINIASVHGIVASVAKAPYVAAKHGLVGMSKVAALEYASAGSKSAGGVTVNCICPGWTETAIIEPQVAARAAEHGGDRDAGVASLLSEKQPSLRTSDPSEIGAVAAFLCQPAMHNITGISIPVDGGWTAQ